ncbi:MAG: LuxR C-terminal-related transcriptional regulator [Tenuifilaceae bacterium]|nr:LuxR C-terminal-related transcriptional regulator [Tenuifilaceae bacterium]
MSKVNFIVVEPSFIVRNGLVNIINEQPNAIVLREIEHTNSFFDNLNLRKVRVAIVNATLLHNLSIVEKKKLIAIKPQVFIVALSYSDSEKYENSEELIDLWLKLSESQSSVTKKIKDIISRYQTDSLQQETAGLSEREITILKDVAMGFSSKEIADKNFISPHTVITHRKNITRKLGIKTVSGLVIYAILNKIIGVDELK